MAQPYGFINDRQQTSVEQQAPQGGALEDISERPLERFCMNIDYLLSLPLRSLVVLGSSLSLLAAVGIGIFLAYRKLEIMESHLSNCRFIACHSHYWGSSPRERMARLVAVYVAIALPKLNARRGIIDLPQVQAFPRSFKIALHGMSLIGVAGAIGAGTVYFADQLNM
jgi:hypothetical protein